VPFKRVFGVPAFAVLFLSCTVGAGRPAPQGLPRQCLAIKVDVTAESASGNPVAPGTPVTVVIRSGHGVVLHAGVTDADGKGMFEVCWSQDDPPAQVEARLVAGPRFVGTFMSFFNYTDTYCLTLPPRFGGHCGEWGTGPNIGNGAQR
jgi:hypothetical protein